MAQMNTIRRKSSNHVRLEIPLRDCREKARIPAWCDRILRKGNNLKQIDYTTAPLRFSDHRPVYATFQCTISSIDEQQKEKLSRSLYDRRKRDIAGSGYNHEKTDEDIVGYNSIAEGLPPASSHRRKWWLDNGMNMITCILKCRRTHD